MYHKHPCGQLLPISLCVCVGGGGGGVGGGGGGGGGRAAAGKGWWSPGLGLEKHPPMMGPGWSQQAWRRRWRWVGGGVGQGGGWWGCGGQILRLGRLDARERQQRRRGTSSCRSRPAIVDISFSTSPRDKRTTQGDLTMKRPNIPHLITTLWLLCSYFSCVGCS